MNIPDSINCFNCFQTVGNGEVCKCIIRTRYKFLTSRVAADIGFIYNSKNNISSYNILYMLELKTLIIKDEIRGATLFDDLLPYEDFNLNKIESIVKSLILK